MTYLDKIQKAKELALNQVIYFLEMEAEHADIRYIKVATDIIKNLENVDEMKDSNVNILIQRIAAKFNLPQNQEELQKLYRE